MAGATLAAYLGMRGQKSICLIERNWTERDTIVGELLQPGGVHQLQQMHLDFLLHHIDAQDIRGYALFLEGHHFSIAYPGQGNLSGKGFRNGRFLQNIRHFVDTLPSITCIEGEAMHLIERNNNICGVRYFSRSDNSEHQIEASLTVVCDGPFSTLRSQLSSSRYEVTGYFLGIILKNAVLPYPSYGHVVVARPSPFLCYPVGSSETRVLIDFPGQTPPKRGPVLSDYLRNIIGRQMPESLQSAFYAAIEENKFKVMPNHRMAACPLRKPGAVLLGDSLNMRHPLTGGGMTVAFTDVRILGEALHQIDDLRNPSSLQSAIDHFYSMRHTEDATINILADALYGVMRNDDLKRACYHYLQRGGMCAEQPISILAAICRDVRMLIWHFFAVALYGVRKTLSPFPTYSRLRRSYALLRDALHIIHPLIMSEKPDRVIRIAMSVSEKLFSLRAAS